VYIAVSCLLAACGQASFAVAAQPDVTDVGFWRAVPGYAELDDDNAVDPIGHGSPFTGQRPTPGKSWPSSTPADARSVLAGPSAPKDLDPIVAARS
jgi:hypothetical protein